MKKEISFYVLDRNEHMTAELSTTKTGKHTPVLTATVSEKLDSYDVLTLTIPADDENAGKLREDYTIIFEDIKGWREYIVTNIEENDGETMETTITAELSSIELLDEPLTVTNTSGSADPELVLESVLAGTRWSVGTVDESIYNQTFTENIQYKNVLEVLDMISSAYSCEVSFSYTVGAKGITGRYVNLYKQIGQDRGKWFEIDKDVREITRTIDTADIKTAVIPYGTEPEEAEEGQEQGNRLTIKDVVWSVANGDPVDKPAGQEYIGDPDALEQWGKLGNDGTRRHRYLLLEIDAETPEKIAQMAWVSLGRYTKPKVTYEADVLDLYTLSGDEDLLHEHVNLGDRAVIIDRYFTVPIMIKARIVEQERDLLDPLNNEIVLGDSKETFSVGDVSAEVEELKNKVSKVSYKASYAQLTGSGVHSYAGSEQPADPNKGDLWYQPHPTVTGAFIYSRYNGTSWVEIFDTSDLSNVEEIANRAQTDADKAVKDANSAVSDASSAVDKATSAETKADNAETKAGNAETTANDALTKAGNAETLASSADSTASEADSKAISAVSKADSAIADADSALSKANANESALLDKVDSSEYSSYKLQTAGLIADKVSSADFTSYQTQTASAIASKVGSDDYETYKLQTADLIADKVASTDFESYKTQTASEISSKVSSDEFSTYTSQTDSALSSKVDSSDFESYQTQTADLIADKVSSSEFSSYQTQTANEIADKVSSEDFESYQTQTDSAISSKVESEEFVSYKQQTDQAISESVSSDEFGTYKTQTEKLISSKVATEDYSNDITQIENNINLRVAKGDVINQINVSDESILIDGTKLHITSKTYIDNAVITDAMIKGLTADKITAGEIDANVVNIINLHADNITGGDLNMRNVRIMNGPTPVMTVSGTTNEVELNISKLTINAIDVEEEIADTKQAVTQAEKDAKAHADSVAGTAESNAKSHANSVAGTAESNAKSHADSVAQAKADLAEKQAKAHADNVVSDEEKRAIQDAKNKLEEAKSHADKAVEDLEIGGSNLVTGTSSQEEAFSFKGYNGKAYGVPEDFLSEIVSGGTFTMSGWLNVTEGSGSVGFMFSFRTSSGSAIRQITDLDMFFNVGESGYFTSTIAVPNMENSDVGYAEMHLRNSYSSGSATGYIKKAKLERGSKATDYRLSEEDRDAQINDKADSTDVNELTGSVGTLAETVANDTVAKSDYQTFLDNYEDRKKTVNDGIEEAEKSLSEIDGRTTVVENKFHEGKIKWEFVDTTISQSDNGILVSNGPDNTGVLVSDNRISFMDGGVEVAHISGQQMQINHGIFVKSAQIGKHKIETLPDSDVTVVNFVG